MPELGVNIDHVATVRQARRTVEPDPVWAAVAAELGGADQITVHLREDRRHIQDRDVRVLRQTVRCRLNLEMAIEPAITDFALEIAPQQATLVPEKREEVTTEGGLDIIRHRQRVQTCCDRLHGAGIEVSLFIDPAPEQVQAAVDFGVKAVELHTGRYADATTPAEQAQELAALCRAGELAHAAGLRLHVGHGLTYLNVIPIAQIPHCFELNIGHSIVARALMVGMEAAVREMKRLIQSPRAPGR